MTWGDKMTKAEIEDIFGEFEIDEDYMLKTKDVVGLFVAQKKKRRRKLPHHHQSLSQLQKKMTILPRRRRKRRRRLPSKCPHYTIRTLTFPEQTTETAVLEVSTTLFPSPLIGGNWSKFQIVNISFAGLFFSCFCRKTPCETVRNP